MGRSGHEVQVRIYDQSEHDIGNTHIDRDALKIIHRLRQKGYKAYVVGGAVRDLLLGIMPKDYDIVTDATPTQIRRHFSHCRVIGGRFRLIHVYFHGGKIIELATFRSQHDPNAFGRIEQDAQRRDFTSNALYYDPDARYVIDYVGGYKDIRAGKLAPVLPLRTIFTEDPVRMIRAVKYAIQTGLTIVRPLSHAILRDAHLLQNVSFSRLTEEFMKIVLSRNACNIFTTLHKYRLLPYLQPELSALLKNKKQSPQVIRVLEKMNVRGKGQNTLHDQMGKYLQIFSFDFCDSTREQRLAMAKKMIKPITPPNSVVSDGIERLFRQYRNQRKSVRS